MYVILSNVFAPPSLGWGRWEKCSDIFSNIFECSNIFVNIFWCKLCRLSKLRILQYRLQLLSTFSTVLYSVLSWHLYFILHFSYLTSYLKSYFFESQSILVLCKGKICTHRFILGQDNFLCFTGTVSKRTFNTWYSITQEIG